MNERIKILIATPFLPWPLCDGGRAAQYKTLESLSKDCDFTVMLPVTEPNQEEEAREFSEKFSHVRLKTVRCYEVPAPVSTQVKIRRAVGRMLRSVFPPPKMRVKLDGGVLNERLPHYPFSVLDQRFINSCAAEIGMGYDIFQCEFIDMLTLGLLVPKQMPKLFIHHQLHSMYARRMVEENPNPSAGAWYLANRIEREEAAFLELYDTLVVFSRIDAGHLARMCPGKTIEVSPFPTPEEPAGEIPPHRGGADAFVLLASEYHPNIDGLNWFMEKVWPAIRLRRPGAKLKVVGRWSEGVIKGICRSAEIEFLGFVPEINRCLINCVMVVPLWVGSGIRSKILVAWGAGCPVVSTSIGIEGIDAVSGVNSMVADSAESFASACLELAGSADLRNRISRNALLHVKSEYSSEVVRGKRLSIYKALLNKNNHSWH